MALGCWAGSSAGFLLAMQGELPRKRPQIRRDFFGVKREKALTTDVSVLPASVPSAAI